MTTKTPTEIVAAQAAHWRGRVDVLTGAIATAARSLAEAEAERRSLAIAAAGGDAKAVARLTALRRLKAETEERLDDLRMALDEAGRQLKDAEDVHARAVRADLLATARAIADQRIEQARLFDQGAQMMVEAAARWQDLGEKLLKLSLPQFQCAAPETAAAITGPTRLEKAFPTVLMRRVFPLVMNAFPADAPLATSEANLWATLPAA